MDDPVDIVDCTVPGITAHFLPGSPQAGVGEELGPRDEVRVRGALLEEFQGFFWS